MNVLFDNIIFSLQRTGGISSLYKELIGRALADKDLSVSFLEYEDAGRNVFRKELDIPERSILQPVRGYKIRRYVNPVIRQNSPFVFHSTYYRTCGNPYARNVTVVHDFTYEMSGENPLKRFVHSFQKVSAIRKSDAIVCVSENTRSDLLKYVPGVDPEKVRVIHNGVSNKYGVIAGKICGLENYLLFVGGRSGYKNASFLVDSVKGLGFKVAFCGNPLTVGEKREYDSILGKGNYKVYGNLSCEELNVVYNSVKCLVYPSSYEGFGIPILEAQKAGCPVIALNRSSIPEIIGDRTLLMDSLDRNELLSKLELLENEDLRRRVICAGLENAGRFSWDTAYQQYKSIYLRLLGCPV